MREDWSTDVERVFTLTTDAPVLDDLSRDDPVSKLGTTWAGYSDRVMGGVSRELLGLTEIHGRRCLRLSGDVRLENNGGFIQMSLDLAPDGGTLDVSAYRGLSMDVSGNGERYGVHLRTPDCVRPWQSYRETFLTKREWTTLRIPFSTFQPHRLSAPLDTTRLRRLGLVAIGRKFHADLSVATVALF